MFLVTPPSAHPAIAASGVRRRRDLKSFSVCAKECEQIRITVENIVPATPMPSTNAGAFHDLCNALPGGALTENTSSAPLLRHGDVYQFGVARGWSLGRIIDVLDIRFGGKAGAVWGFDTFTGMPEETPGQPTIAIWSKGHFSPGGPAANASLARQLGGRVQWVIGDYENSLTASLAQERGMRRARYVDIDCDLYRSAHLAIHWVFASKLVAPGTVVGYDDFWDLPCSMQRADQVSWSRHPLQSGEGKAHVDVSRGYGVSFRCICGPCQAMPMDALRQYSSWRVYFVIESIEGDGRGTPGFTMPTEQREYFLAHNERCVSNANRWKVYLAESEP